MNFEKYSKNNYFILTMSLALILFIYLYLCGRVRREEGCGHLFGVGFVITIVLLFSCIIFQLIRTPHLFLPILLSLKYNEIKDCLKM